MNLVRQLDEHIWHEFVDQHPQGTVFHTPELFQVFAQTNGYHPDLWVMADKNHRPMAFMVSVKITQVAGLSQFTSRSIVHGGVLCAPGAGGRQALDALLKTYKQAVKHAVLYTELRNLSDASELAPVMSQNGFAGEQHLNYLIDLDRPADQVFQSIGKRTRKKIRRGHRSGRVCTTAVTVRSELDEWYAILDKTYRYARVPLADSTLFEAVFDLLCPRNMAKFFVARVDGVPAACSLELLYRDTVYGWYGGMDRQYSSYHANELMHWHILEWSVNHGYRIYDFGGAGRPGEPYGVRDFKAKFGGELVDFGRHSYVHSPGRLKLTNLAYRFYRKILWTPKRC
jgi:lipid II:glycine glycyltransferase (peptidoglycan interpeptide bridge formation enzyme)